MIDTMMENLRHLQEKKALHEAQVASQERETKVIGEIIRDTTTEIEAVQFEKKQLFQEWKSSLLIFQKREEIHKSVELGIQ